MFYIFKLFLQSFYKQKNVASFNKSLLLIKTAQVNWWISMPLKLKTFCWLWFALQLLNVVA